MKTTRSSRALKKKDIEGLVTTGGLRKYLRRFATKKDLEKFATKKDLERFATKEDLERFATKEDLQKCATKEDIHVIHEMMKGMQMQWVSWRQQDHAESKVLYENLLHDFRGIFSDRLSQHDDKLQDHERRIRRVEGRVLPSF